MKIDNKSNLSDLLIDIFNNVPENIYCLDLTGKLIFCNNNQLKAFGLKHKDELLGKDIFDVGRMLNWPESFAKNINNHDRHVMRSLKTVTREETIIFDKKKYFFLARKSPWFDEQSNLIGVIGVSIDITTQKELEESRKKQEELENLSHYMKLFAGSIAHELRTPLASIRAGMGGLQKYLPILIDAYDKAQKAGLEVESIRSAKLDVLRNFSTTCISEINFSNNYIDMILGNLKFNSNELITHDYLEYNISGLINDAILAYPCNKHQFELIDLNTDNDFKFWGHPAYLKSMINNLLKNAFYYIAEARKGSILIQTRVGKKNDKFNYLTFKDTAKGAPPNIIKKMFDGLYSNRLNGAGFGLYFCKTIMRSFGGDIQAESVEGEYMKFTFSFPKLKIH